MAKQTLSEGRPGKHPDPPENLTIGQIQILKRSGPWYRLNPVQHQSALYFDKSGDGRFDGPGQGYGILYLGDDSHTCFIECFGRTHTKAVEEAALKQRNLFEIKPTRSLNFANLSGKGLVKLGADSRLTTGDYVQARKWVQAIWELGKQIDGICYRSRLDNDRFCYGLFDQTRSEVIEQNLGTLVESQPRILAQILSDYDYALL